MNISKKAIITTIFALSIILIIVYAIISGKSDPYPNTTKYLKDAFNENNYGVTIIDSDKGEDVTDSFISENKELYENGDWDTIMENFNKNHLFLSVERNSDEEWKY